MCRGFNKIAIRNIIMYFCLLWLQQIIITALTYINFFLNSSLYISKIKSTDILFLPVIQFIPPTTILLTEANPTTIKNSIYRDNNEQKRVVIIILNLFHSTVYFEIVKCVHTIS